jgi:hypothetical protein
MSELWKAFLESRAEIETYALRKGERAQRQLASRGLDLGELEMIPLVNHVFELLRADKISWDPCAETIFQFFRRQVHNRVRSFELTRRGIHLSLVSTDVPCEGEIAIDRLPADLEAAQNIFNVLDWNDLLRFLAPVDLRLPQLADLIQAGFTVSEQAQMLGVSASTRFRLQRMLAHEVVRYRVQASRSPTHESEADAPTRDSSDNRA